MRIWRDPILASILRIVGVYGKGVGLEQIIGAAGVKGVKIIALHMGYLVTTRLRITGCHAIMRL